MTFMNLYNYIIVFMVMVLKFSSSLSASLVQSLKNDYITKLSPSSTESSPKRMETTVTNNTATINIKPTSTTPPAHRARPQQPEDD